jgi:predicted transposase YdaD
MPVDFRELPLIRELMEEGREEGLEQGLEQGRLEAPVLVAEERFGALPLDITQKILRGELALPAVAHVVAQADSIDALREGLQ